MRPGIQRGGFLHCRQRPLVADLVGRRRRERRAHAGAYRGGNERRTACRVRTHAQGIAISCNHRCSVCLRDPDRIQQVRRPGVLASLRPQLMLPKRARKLFPVASCTFVSTWAFGGFYQGFGPSMATDLLGTSSALVAAAVFACVMAPSAIGGALTGRLSPAAAQRFGMCTFLLAVAAVLLSLKARMVVPFLCASAMVGAAQGATLAGSIRGLLAKGSPDERAGAFSVVYATCYAGAAIPSLIAGQLSRTLDLFQMAMCYGILAALGCLITLVAARNPEKSGD